MNISHRGCIKLVNLLLNKNNSKKLYGILVEATAKADHTFFSLIYLIFSCPME